MTVRVAILGTGWGVRVQAPAFRAAGLEVAALWGRTAERAQSAAESLAIPFATTEVEAILERRDVDLVSITTPPHTHCELSSAALAAGKHVLCEKPTARNAGEARRMLDAARSHPGRLALIDHELRFCRGRCRMRQLLSDGWLGEPLHAEATFAGSGRLGTRWRWGWWSEREKGGGILGALGSHEIDALSWLLDRPIEAVSAHLETLVPERPDGDGRLRKTTSDEYAAVALKFRGGLPGFIQASAAMAGAGVHRLAIAGTAGSLRLEGWRLFGARAGEDREQELTPEDPLELPEGLIDHEWSRATVHLGRALRRALADGDETALAGAADFADGLYVQRVLDAAHASARKGTWKSVEPG